MGSTVLVTGGGGFVGSALVRRMARTLAAERVLPGVPERPDDGDVDRVVAVLRPGGSRERLDELSPGPGWGVVEADLTDRAAVKAMMEEVRPVAVMHTALDRRVYGHATPEILESGVAAPLAGLIHELARWNGARFIHAGSAWVLPGGDALDEQVSPDPASPYARAKALQDRLLPELASSAGIEWINLRLFNLFGRYERPDRLIPYLVRHLSGGRIAELSAPGNVRDFTDVDLVSRAFTLALASPSAAANRLYHIGTGLGTSIREMAGFVADVVGGVDLVRFDRTERPDAAMETQVSDIGRARQGLGWNPPDDLSSRVRAAARWWRERLEIGADSMTTTGRHG